MKPNPFFLSRNHGSHLSGDRIEFAAHINRSLSIPEAIDLCAHLAVLIDDDKAVGKRLHELRGKKSPKELAEQESAELAEEEAETHEAEPEGADAPNSDATATEEASAAADEPVIRKRSTRRSHAA